jgi:quercetin dioxygenase-like cupin family protein
MRKLVGWILVACGAAGAAAPLAAQEPSGTIESRVVMENDSVQVAVLAFPPGSASGRHVGLDPELGIVLEGELTLVTDAGKEVMRPGTARFLPALVPHDARNEGDRPVKLWVVFLKRCE